MLFRYFEGPIDEMFTVGEGTHECSICGKENSMCFELEFAETDRFPEKERDGKLGCVNCLKNGEFEFCHHTEFGYINKEGKFDTPQNRPEGVKALEHAKLEEFRRTPGFSTWQTEQWLIHCNDFMTYKGTWEPEDFKKNSKDGDGKQLFLDMTDKDWDHLWDESMEDGELEEWYATYYVFECKHCGKLRGNWDCN